MMISGAAAIVRPGDVKGTGIYKFYDIVKDGAFLMTFQLFSSRFFSCKE